MECIIRKVANIGGIMKKQNITRKKLTKEFIDLYIHCLPYWRLKKICTKHLKKKLNNLSEKDFVKKLEEKHFGVDSVAQWDLFQEYVSQKI